MSEYLLISDAAKEVCVESHVLRYWEEELHLPIKRNELGHRYYTEEDVERFKQIKSMKERGLQLKAIKMILKNGKLDLLEEKKPAMAIEIVEEKEGKIQKNVVTNVKNSSSAKIAVEPANEGITKEEKARKLMWLMQQMMNETLQENNKVLCQEMKETMIKELDYQFRTQEEREEERDKAFILRNEQYYEKMDQLLREKTKRKEWLLRKSNGQESKHTEGVKVEKVMEEAPEKGKIKQSKKKRHFPF